MLVQENSGHRTVPVPERVLSVSSNFHDLGFATILSIYNRKVLFVCLSRKMITLPTGLKSSSLTVFMVIHGSRLVFHGSRSVFMVFHGSRLVFLGSRSFFTVFHGSRLVFHGYTWFHVVFSGYQVGFHGFSWFQNGFSWFRVVFYVFFMVPG